MHYYNSARRGFTLVELSIVLVIIGLLIGGILGGQELIRSSELNSVTADVNKFKVSLNAFKLKYNALPGDMTNATSYWGGTTANGNGDGMLLWVSDAFRSWQQLNLSGIVPGNFTGVLGGGATPGTNIPESKITGAGFGLYNMDMDASGTSAHPIRILLGGFVTGTTNWAAVISAQDASAIDSKSDDGLPRSGNSSAATGSGAGAACYSGTAYVLTSVGVVCMMQFRYQ